MKAPLFPEFIRALPRPELRLDGLEAHLVQGTAQQVLFMRFERDVSLPEHTHCAQWAAVLEGEIALTVAGRTTVYRRGDRYFIAAGQPHSSEIRAGYADVTVFDAADRYAVEGATPEAG